MEWITQNLFVGNKLWSGQVQAQDGHPFNLRNLRSPIILFASAGDNITPPQQAFNWVAARQPGSSRPTRPRPLYLSHRP